MRTFNKSYQKIIKEYNVPDDPIPAPIPPGYDPDLDTSSAYEGIQSQYLSSDPGDTDPDLVAYVKKEVKDIVDESGLSVEEALKIVKEELPDVIQAIGVDEFTGEFNLGIEDNEVHLQGTGWAGKPPPVDEEESDWTIKMARSHSDAEDLLRASQHPPHKGGLEGSDLERFEVWRKKISRLLDELSYGEEVEDQEEVRLGNTINDRFRHLSP